MQSNTITRSEYDRLRLANQPLPKADVLIEPDGKRVDLILTSGDTVQRTNPRTQSKEVLDALVQLADLTEYYDLGRKCNNGPTPLSNLLDGGEAFQLQHDETLLKVTSAALKQLEGWIDVTSPYRKKLEVKTFQQTAEGCVAFLRAKGF